MLVPSIACLAQGGNEGVEAAAFSGKSSERKASHGKRGKVSM